MQLCNVLKLYAQILLASLALLIAALLISGCGGAGGSTPHTQPPAAPRAQLTALPVTISTGQTSTLTWSSTNATSVSISPAITTGAPATSGSQTVTPATTTTYTMTATGDGGTTTATATVTVRSLPLVSITVTPGNISSGGQSALLQWTTTNTTSISIVPSVLQDDQGSLPLNGSTAVQPTQNTTYVITATGPGGTATASAALTFTQLDPTVQLSVNPTSIKLNGSATLSWTTTNANVLLIVDQTHNPINLGGSVPFGSVSITPPTIGLYTYTATATNNVTHKSATTTATLNVGNFGATLTAAPGFIQAGATATLNYAITTDPGKTVTSVSIDGGIGSVSPTGGTVSVTPPATHTYTLTATQSDGLVTTATTTVAVAGGLADNIQHIVIFVQANHSFDNYFGKLGQYKASKGFVNDIDGIPDATDPNFSKFSIPDPTGVLTAPFHQKSICMDELVHGWNESYQNVNKQADGSYKMDQFLITAASFNPSRDPMGRRAIGYYDQTDIPYYYELAAQFATSDRWFAPVLDDAVPNRMYLEAGTSYGTTLSGVYTTPGAYQQPTIFNRLTAAGITWRYYTQDATDFLARYSTTTPAEFANVRQLNEYFSLMAGQPTADTTLAQVVFVESGGDIAETDEAPDPGKGIQAGERRSARIINALMGNQAYWATSAFFLTWDEPGGFFDHVPPQSKFSDGRDVPAPDSQAPSLIGPRGVTVFPGDFLTTGMRVPLVVVSPWVKAHYNSKVVRDSTALLKFIETRFNLTPLTARDAAQDDMTEMFDFANAPPFLVPPILPPQSPTRFCDEVDEGNNQ